MINENRDFSKFERHSMFLGEKPPLVTSFKQNFPQGIHAKSFYVSAGLGDDA
jgi:hypothetical protein